MRRSATECHWRRRRPVHPPAPRTCASVAVLVVATLGLVGEPTPSAAVALSTSAPLSTTMSTATGTWAVLPMGDLGQVANTFWQLFYRPAGGARWSLVTPPGVADNGGLVLTGRGTSVTVAFVPSQDLRFTPLAWSSDDGADWSPAVLPAAIDPVPDALGPAPGGASQWAVTASGTRVTRVAETAGTVVTTAALEQASAGSCRTVRVDALAGNGTSTFAGATCLGARRVPVFETVGDGWRVVGPKLPSPSLVSVLRLTVTGDALQAVVARSSGASIVVRLLSSNDSGATWTWSAPLRLPPAATLVSVSPGPGARWTVVWRPAAGSTRLGAIISGSKWSTVTTVPPGTQVLTTGAGTKLEALATKGSRLTVWQLNVGHWVSVLTTTVPIQYGSSS